MNKSKHEDIVGQDRRDRRQQHRADDRHDAALTEWEMAHGRRLAFEDATDDRH